MNDGPFATFHTSDALQWDRFLDADMFVNRNGADADAGALDWQVPYEAVGTRRASNTSKRLSWVGWYLLVYQAVRCHMGVSS